LTVQRRLTGRVHEVQCVGGGCHAVVAGLGMHGSFPPNGEKRRAAVEDDQDCPALRELPVVFLFRHAFLGRDRVLAAEARITEPVWASARRLDGGRQAFNGRVPERVDAEPLAHFQKHVPLVGGNRAVGHGRDIEQQLAVLAHDIDEYVDHLRGRLDAEVLRVAPASPADGIVREPGKLGKVVHATFLEILHAYGVRQVALFVRYNYLVTPFGGPVEVMREIHTLVFLRNLVEPGIEPHQVRPVSVNNLHELALPHLEEIIPWDTIMNTAP